MSVLAFDLGASSGRAAVGTFDGRILAVEEIHRFPNDPVWAGDRLHLDILRLLHEVKQGILAAHRASADPVESFGIDSWGLDFGLLDEADALIANPRHHRDAGDPAATEQVLAAAPRQELYARTGIQILPMNTLFQMVALARANPSALARAKTLLQIPDLIRFFLTGEQSSEYTNATTTQCIALATGDWDRALLHRLGLPTEILRPIVRAPLAAGELRPSVRDELGLPAVRAVVVAEHDTASAVAAVPAEGEFAYLSCGTWSLLGTELTEPILDERAMAWNFSNEGGLAGTIRFLKNIAGLWLVESCRRIWRAEGPLPSHAEMEAAILAAPPFTAFIDPDDPAFLNPSSMPDAIQSYCQATDQPSLGDRGSILRCVHESLALKYRLVFDRLEELTGRRFSGLHLVGGGTLNSLLCQFTANALGRPVWAGPTEATTIGNILVQLMAAGRIGSLREAREIVRASFPIRTYEPHDGDGWPDAYGRFAALIAAQEGRQ